MKTLYYGGPGTDLGNVTVLPANSFEKLCALLKKPVILPISRKDYDALPTKRAKSDAKRTRYLTPATFDTVSSARKTEFAANCNLICLDVDDAESAKRLLTQNWEDLMGGFGYVVWHTVSSTPVAPRLRVIVRAENIPAIRYAQAVKTLAEQLGLGKVTHESLVPVQPMFFPTVCSDDEREPLVASNPEGEAFMEADILGEQETVMGSDGESKADPDIGDLEFLRAPMEDVTLEDAAGALAVLDPDMPMQNWIEVAAGLKHQFNSKAAYEIWDAWSQKGKKYETSEETAYRWKTLKAQPADRAPVTIRSLFKQAQALGWSNPSLGKRAFNEALAWLKNTARSTEELLDKGTAVIAKASPTMNPLERKVLMHALKAVLAGRDSPLPLPDIKREVLKLEMEAARTTGVAPWAKGLCYVTSLNVFYRHTVDRRFAPEVLDLMYSTPQIGEEKPMRPRDYLMQVLTVPQVENLRYDPARGEKRFFNENSVPYVNTYRPSGVAPEPERAGEAGAIFQEHIRNLIAEPEYGRLLIDFLAYQIQQPGKKIRWAVLLQGAQGCGKTALAVIMAAMLGRRNARKVSAHDVMDGKYNDWAAGQQLVTIEEVRIIGHNRYAVMDKLKPCISDDEISLNKKWEHHQTVPNVTNYLMFTNHHDSLAINDEDRRYFVLASPLQRKDQITALGGTKYFDRLFGMIRDNVGGLRAWFEQWKISDNFNPEGRAPLTKYLKELADNSASPLTAAVADLIADEPDSLIRKDLVSLTRLRAYLGAVEGLPIYSDQTLASVLREMGWIKYGRHLVGGSKHSLWIRDNITGNIAEIASDREELL